MRIPSWRGEIGSAVIFSNLDGLDGNIADVTVVGAGPAGLVTALELARRGLNVTLLESGFDAFSAEQQALSDAEFAEPGRHHAMEVAVRRALGGTSLLWGGRCVSFDDIDFEPRPHVPESGWPFEHCTVRPWYETAARYLDCGTAVFTVPADPAPDRDCRRDTLERWSNTRNLRQLHARELQEDPRVRVFLGATVVGLEFDIEAGAIRGLTVARPDGRRFTLRARAYVLACGGLEATRLLLAAQAGQPAMFGGNSGALGRFYMTHLSGKIADIIFTSGETDAAMDFYLDASGRYARRRITVAPSAQRSNCVLNMAAWPDNPPLNDPAHGSAILSLAYLALAVPPVGRRLVAEAIRRTYVGQGPRRIDLHLFNLLRGLPAAATLAGRFLKGRLGATRLPGFFVRNAAHRYSLHYHSEHAPNSESRVALSSTRDALGLRRLSIDVRYGTIDAVSVVRSHELIDAWLRSTGFGRLIYRVPTGERESAVLAAAGGGSHQIGTIRMSADARRGITDGDCRVHGIPNLFVASSAVFPTSGQANPTLLIAALAARLADKLAREGAKLPDPANI